MRVLKMKWWLKAEKPTRRGQPFPPATVAALRAYHIRGMVGVGKYEGMIDEAAKETNLSEDQIKV